MQKVQLMETSEEAVKPVEEELKGDRRVVAKPYDKMSNEERLAVAMFHSRYKDAILRAAAALGDRMVVDAINDRFCNAAERCRDLMVMSGRFFDIPGNKQGRNDLCQCGSGKKFKKCCAK